ncbi:hypothetical protein SNE35_02420 [Paucibacter sp. R3-3]|uniref:Uncharacterized protein n=1 Tax=Roseateles agri TaxID=3098619 RepID=A0ABU5DDL2_9BURK|nr:hypothetical protein [Paucibacter sp. R3-3]MDY0743339.1 hypothetical protein [Paucibacter sp. R3-3]
MTTSLDWDYISETLYDGFGRSYGTRYRRPMAPDIGGSWRSVTAVRLACKGWSVYLR